MLQYFFKFINNFLPLNENFVIYTFLILYLLRLWVLVGNSFLLLCQGKDEILIPFHNPLSLTIGSTRCMAGELPVCQGLVFAACYSSGGAELGLLATSPSQGLTSRTAVNSAHSFVKSTTFLPCRQESHSEIEEKKRKEGRRARAAG